MLARARLRTQGGEQEVVIVDVSPGGLAGTTDYPPARGDFVEILVGDNALVGQVKWSSTRRFGISLRERISVISLLSGESGGVTLRQRETVRREQARSADDHRTRGRRLEFLIFCAAGVLGTLIVADFIGDALQGLQIARTAMAGTP